MTVTWKYPARSHLVFTKTGRAPIVIMPPVQTVLTRLAGDPG
jgi:hypothetical protein